MGLVDRAKQGPPSTKNHECTIAILLRELPKDEARALSVMLADPLWSSAAIGRGVSEEYPKRGRLSGGTVSRHRVGECCCPKS
jgi:hypothetical protein